MLSIIIVGFLAVTGQTYAELLLPPRNVGSKAQPTIEPINESINFIIPSDSTETTIEPKMVAHIVNHEVPRDLDFSSLYCSGTNLQKKEIAGVCTDGNFLWFSGFDCGGKCKCDGTGEVSCDIPSDCGPQKDVVDYCMNNPMFKCDCLSSTQNKDKLLGSGNSLDESFDINAKIRGIDALALARRKSDPRSDAEEGEGEGIPMISPCFYDPAEACGPYTPESRRTEWPPQATTMVEAIK